MSDAISGAFDPLAIIRALQAHDVRYVLAGGVATRLHGSPTLTEDIDITPARTEGNLGRLAAALVDLDARLGVADVDGIRRDLRSSLDSSLGGDLTVS